MRSFIATLILLGILICAVTLNSLYVGSVCEKITLSAEHMSSRGYIENECSELLSFWRKHKDMLSLSIESDELEQMEGLIESLCALGKESNSEEFVKCCHLISSLGRELSEYERISFYGLL